MLGNHSEAITLKLVDSPGSQFEIQVRVYLHTLASIYTTLDSQAHSTMATNL